MEDGAPPDYCDFDDLLLQMSEKRTLLIKQPSRIGHRGCHRGGGNASHLGLHNRYGYSEPLYGRHESIITHPLLYQTATR